MEILKIEISTELTALDVNLNEKFKEIVEAKDSFNKKSKGNSFIILADVESNAIKILARLDNIQKKSVNYTKSINGFLTILMKEYGWNKFKKIKNSKIFNIKLIKKMSVEESEIEIKQTVNEYKKYNTTSELSIILAEQKIENSLLGEKSKLLREEFENSLDYNNNITKTSIKAIKSLIGNENFKREISTILNYVEFSRKVLKNVKNQNILPINYLFFGKQGINHYDTAKMLMNVYNELEINISKKDVKIDVSKQNDYYWDYSFGQIFNDSKLGMVFLENVCSPFGEVDYKKIILKILTMMHQYRGKKLIILSYYYDEKTADNFSKLLKALNNNVNYRKIELLNYTKNDILKLIKVVADENNIKVTTEVIEEIYKKINEENELAKINVKFPIEKILEKLIVDKKFNKVHEGNFSIYDEDEFVSIKTEDLKTLEVDNEIKYKDNPIEELNQMIGLENVKSRVEQISNFVKVREMKKKLGLKLSSICMHMEFTGNPGTGKTTVARIIGKVFKSIGYLSSGHFVEVTRENLIGPYIGQTLPKVKKIIEEATGGVLFIDEAYSLNAHSENDYGIEALSYIVKVMEDLRDNLIIIFAGYPKEMEELISLNPGLKDRIGFKIDFPDYDCDDLLKIFLKILVDNEYKISDEASNNVKELIQKLIKSKTKNFGNGRLMRNLFEKLEIIQNRRICKEKLFNINDIQCVIVSDVEELLVDTEIIEMINNTSSKGKIGF